MRKERSEGCRDGWREGELMMKKNGECQMRVKDGKMRHRMQQSEVRSVESNRSADFN